MKAAYELKQKQVFSVKVHRFAETYQAKCLQSTFELNLM